MLLTEVPPRLAGRGIMLPSIARGFALSLDTAEPWGGGKIAGRVEARAGRHGPLPVTVSVSCSAAWLDLAPQLAGKGGRLRDLWELRMRQVPIWIEDQVWVERWEVGDLREANWRPFSFELPEGLPRALEGTFASFRWRIEASRPRRVGSATTSLPLLLDEPQELPTVRIETTPVGTWRLLEWRSELDSGGSAGPCEVCFEERRPEDLPLPGETRAQERARRGIF